MQQHIPTSTSRSTGLRKFISQPDRYSERYGNLTLTARDLEILQAVYRYRYLEARHIRALVTGSDQQITRRLQGLFHNGYLGRYARRARIRLELDPGAPLMAYGLDLKGARALEHNRNRVESGTGRTKAPVLWRKDYTRRTEWFLEHHLMISNFRCVLELALRETRDTELVTWDQSKNIWFRARVPGRRQRTVRVAPDAYFALRQGHETRHFFLEADRSTEEHRKILSKFVGYWWYLQDAEAELFPANARRVNVLFVTTGTQRLENMVRTLREMPKPNRARNGGKGVFWFCAEPSYGCTDPTTIRRAIWRTVNDSVRRRL